MSKQQNTKKTGNFKKVGIILLVIAIAALVIFVNVWNYLSKDGYFARQKVAIETENFSVSEAQMSYYFRSQYLAAYNTLAGYGLDPSMYFSPNLSLKAQTCVFSSDKTWFQYFMESAVTSVSNQLALCEAAKAAGFELDSDDMEEIDANIKILEDTAKAEGYSLNNYIKSYYGSVVSEKDLRASLEIEFLANKYLESEIEKVDISDETIKGIYEKDKDTYETVDYLEYTFDYEDILAVDKKSTSTSTSTSTSSTDDKKTEEVDPEKKAAAVAKAKEYAEKLAAADSKDAFEAVLKDYYVNVLKMEEATAKKELEKGAHIAEGAFYKKNDEVLTWLFGKDTEVEVSVGAVRTFTEVESHEHKEGDDHANLAEIYTVVYVTRTRGLEEAITAVDVRHILFSKDTYKDDAKAKEIYEQWKRDGATADGFAKLAKEYTEDPGSKFTGGLYEGVAEGTMVTEFNDWIFAEGRKTGDHALIKTEYGWHIMYYEDGKQEWEATIINNLQTEARQIAEENASDAHKVVVDYDVINGIDA